MDKSIIRDFAKLRVLTPYDFQRMDELVQDLTNALEESSANAGSKLRKRRGKKRRPPQMGGIPGLPFSPSDALLLPSEESVSSVDDARALLDPAGLVHQSDSDGVSSSGRLALLNYVQRLSNFPVGHFAESDSVNENFSPVRPHRRKRKFKRMAVDPSEASVMSESGALGGTTLIPIPTRKPHRKKDKSGIIQNIENMYRCHEAQLAVSPVFPGKRKHSMRERSVELLEGDTIPLFGAINKQQSPMVLASTSTTSTQESIGDPQFCVPKQEGRLECGDDNLYNFMESSSSGLSSSESDAGIYTNDEGREADDEQSDFYHEAGPTCGIPGVLPWWDNERLNIDEDGESQALDATFQSILTGSFQHMSYEAQQAFRARVCQLPNVPGREIRAGRRRLRDRRPGFSIVSSVNEKISKFLQDPDQNEFLLANPLRLRLYHMRKTEMHQLNHLASLYSLNMHSEGSKKNKCPVLTKTRNTTQAISVDKCGVNNLWGWTAANDIKRRRRTPPASPEIEGYMGETAEPIAEDNLGNQMLRNMGWEPGAGLGVNPDSIKTPILAYMRPKYQGLGFNVKDASTKSN